jgi:hypothetical protein
MLLPFCLAVKLMTLRLLTCPCRGRKFLAVFKPLTPASSPSGLQSSPTGSRQLPRTGNNRATLHAFYRQDERQFLLIVNTDSYAS